MLLTQHLVMDSVFISCFTAHRADVWALGAQGYFSTQHFINLPGTFNTHIKHLHNLFYLTYTLLHPHPKTHNTTLILDESFDLLRQVTNKV